jgi:TRL-like protein family
MTVAFLAACAGWGDSPAKGIILTAVDGPITATAYLKAVWTGESCAFSILGLVALSDASIHGAKTA